jgi:hypothetical protein
VGEGVARPVVHFHGTIDAKASQLKSETETAGTGEYIEDASARYA